MNTKSYLYCTLTVFMSAVILLSACEQVTDPASEGGSSMEPTTAPTSTPIVTPNATRTGFPELDPAAPFSLDDPSGKPDFTDEEIRSQKLEGNRILDEIETAANDLSVDEYVIPAGNYGFDVNKMYSNAASGFVLKNIIRPDDDPFVIKADGVTFWFSLINKPAPNFSRAIHLINCENISIEGLTVDSYTSNTIEGKLTEIDIPYNRIAVELSDGTITDEALITGFEGTEKRIIPVKADGKAIPALYNINSTWGVEYLFIRKVEKIEEGKYWFYFKSQLLLNTIFEADWLEQYGTDGTLEPGDGISLLFGTMIGISLDNCKQLTIKDVSCYIGKAGFWENGGYGDHKWLNCRFSPRPGTNRILGGEGNMSQGIRHGSLYDNLYIGVTSDDAMNIHGFWSKVKTASSSLVQFDFAPVGIQKGDPVEFYDGAGRLIETNTVAETPASNFNYNGFLLGPIKLDSAPTGEVYSLSARWPNSECNGWKISNSYFEGVYQRILIQTGPGVFEGNTMRDMGSNLALDTNTADYEGGFLRDIEVRNNVFINTAVHPGAFPVKVSFNPNWASNIKASGISITDNVVLGAGASAISLNNVRETDISDNYFLDMHEKSNVIVPYLDLPDVAVSASGSDDLTLSGNRVYNRAEETEGNGIIDQTASLSDNEVISGADDIIDRVWDFVDNKDDMTVADILEIIT